MKHILLAAIFLLLAAGCGTLNRDNPNDPGSDRYYPYGSITLVALNRTGTPLANVQVRVDNIYSKTGIDGKATIDNIRSGRHSISMWSAVYDTIQDTNVTVVPGSTTELRKQMNGIPVFDSVFAVSELLPSGSLIETKMHFYAKVHDIDYWDVLRVWLQVANFDYELTYSSRDSAWVYTADTLNNGQLVYDVVGLPMRFKAVDNPSSSSQLTPAISYSKTVSIARVFNQQPYLRIAPEPMSRYNFLVAWSDSPRNNFSYTMRIKLFSLSDVLLTNYVWVRSNIPSMPDSVESNLTSSFNHGNYWLVLEEVDAFGNYSSADKIKVSILDNR